MDRRVLGLLLHGLLRELLENGWLDRKHGGPRELVASCQCRVLLLEHIVTSTKMPVVELEQWLRVPGHLVLGSCDTGIHILTVLLHILHSINLDLNVTLPGSLWIGLQGGLYVSTICVTPSACAAFQQHEDSLLARPVGSCRGLHEETSEPEREQGPRQRGHRPRPAPPMRAW